MSSRELILSTLADGRLRTAAEIRAACKITTDATHAGLRRLLGEGVVRFTGLPTPTGCGRPATLWRIDPCHQFRSFVPHHEKRKATAFYTD